VFAKLRQFAQRRDEIRAKSDRMRRSKAETLQTINVVHRFEQLDEGAFGPAGVNDVGYSGKLVPTVKVHDLAQECHFFYSVLDQPAHFPNDLRDGSAALGTARPRYDAKSAMHTAALHD